jgi:transposase-like protein
MKLRTINAICLALILALLFLAGQAMAQETQPEAQGLTDADYKTLDSLDAKIQALNTVWTKQKRYGDALNVTDRLEALTFYRQKNVITAIEQEKMVLNLQSQRELELQGTQLIQSRSAGEEKGKAARHLRKVNAELSQITDYLLSINHQQPQIECGKKGKIE